jgi:hypothetical protein
MSGTRSLTRTDSSLRPRCYSNRQIMTLLVEFDGFVEAVNRHIEKPVVYISHHENRTQLTCADPGKQIQIQSSTKSSVAEVQKALGAASITFANGEWISDAAAAKNGDANPAYIAAISYRSGEDMPGVWVDAFGEQPSAAMALKGLYEEFRETGEVGEISFEEFVRLASPNVVIVSPLEIEKFVESKEADCP